MPGCSLPAAVAVLNGGRGCKGATHRTGGRASEGNPPLPPPSTC
uniref:Uncharacterized protein n=1 Tax=Arundo donax TaxID=35708 RepID=A0A0A8Z2P9_ARUDO